MEKRWVGLALALGLGLAITGCGDDDGGGNDNVNQNTLVCGNGVLDSGEACDDGEANSDVQPDACRTDCRTAGCGDGIPDTGEECDEGQANSDLVPGACRRDCRLPYCGDGVLDAGEACDDGGTAAGDGCDAVCRVEPNWECQGSPSECRCRSYFQGSDCGECVVYVDVDQTAEPDNGRSWATAYPRLQDGINAASAARGAGSCDVWVAEGTYMVFEYSVLNTIQLRSGVGVYGGFDGTETARDQRDPGVNETILDGDGQPVPVYHVVSAIDTVDATLDGVIVQHGECFGVDTEDQRGGGITVKAAVLTIDNVLIRDNVGSDGVGIAVEGSIVTLRDSALEGNFAADVGGGIWGHNCLVTLERVDFTSNTARDVGGGIYGNYGDFRLSGCHFEGNVAAAQGGAIYARRGSFEVTNTVFLANETDVPSTNANYGEVSRGGAVLLHDTDNTHFTQCTFSENVSALGGGLAVSGGPDDLQIVGCSFTDNAAQSFVSVSADSEGGGGGAVFIETGTVAIDDCSFEGNVALAGGALEVIAAQVTVTQSTFRSNDATTYVAVDPNLHGAGGAVRTFGWNAVFEGCVFDENRSTGFGGAVVEDGQNTAFHDCTFTNNDAADRGGAVIAFGPDTDYVNCLFAGNQSVMQGGAVLLSEETGTFTNCTFVNNHSSNWGAGIRAFGSPTSPVITNCIFWGNTSPNPNQNINHFPFGASDPAPVVSHCLVEGGYPAGTDIVTGDPVFVDAAGGDFRLQSTSPAIDEADDTVAPTHDLDGNARAAHSGGGSSVADLGCYEYTP